MGFVYEELTDNRKKDYPELEGKYPKGWYIDKIEISVFGEDWQQDIGCQLLRVIIDGNFI